MTERKAKRIELFDTSLRDGLQQPNLDISVPNAVRLLQRMGSFGVSYAEIGFAGANQFVSDLTSAMQTVETGDMKLALFGRSRGRGTRVQDWPDVKFIVANKPRISVAVIVVKSRLLDVEKSLETTPEENLLMVSETIQYLHDSGLEVFVDFEHAMDAACGRREMGTPCNAAEKARGIEYFEQMVEQCIKQKAGRLVVCDTNGGASPEEVSHVMSELVRSYPETNFGFHGHTDRGLGIANTRAAVLAGAMQVQGTLIGTGERCGNVNLTTVIGGMQLRDEAAFVSPEALTGLTGLAHATYAAFGLEPPHGTRKRFERAQARWQGADRGLSKRALVIAGKEADQFEPFAAETRRVVAHAADRFDPVLVSAAVGALDHQPDALARTKGHEHAVADVSLEPVRQRVVEQRRERNIQRDAHDLHRHWEGAFRARESSLAGNELPLTVEFAC